MSLKNINKENRQKLSLKREGHQLVKEIKWKGYSGEQVYEMLAKELGVEVRQSHFSYMHTLRELRKAVEQLEKLNQKLPDTEFKSGSFNTKTVYPQPKVDEDLQTSYNKKAMSINRDAVKEIYAHDGPKAAEYYLVNSENCTWEEAKRVLAVILGKPSPPITVPQGAVYYCVRDKRLIHEDENGNAFCPKCDIDISRETVTDEMIQNIDISKLSQHDQHTIQKQRWYQVLWPFKK